MTTTLDLVPDSTLYMSGITKYITWNFQKHPHAVIFGSTGSGKTYLLKILLGRLGKNIGDSEILLCDYKGDSDFQFLQTCNNFFRFDCCIQGLEQALNLLQERQKNITSDRHFFALVFDEWASFVNNLDKKQAEWAKQSLATLLMLGRSFNIHVILSQQRLDASYFNAARDNFSVIFGMGVLSRESIEMIFREYKDRLDPNKNQGQGSLVIGNQFFDIFVPSVYDSRKLEASILSAVTRLQATDNR